TDRELALQFNHLTAAEAGAFAAEAGVKRLVLNHPSRRYHGNYRQLLNEARRCFTATDIVPYKGGLYQL
ncbi:ribonuclease Z, partial [bacterium]|nr:ribonuclease Z [candidate division CSSED10-310 bacterium]